MQPSSWWVLPLLLPLPPLLLPLRPACLPPPPFLLKRAPFFPPLLPRRPSTRRPTPGACSACAMRSRTSHRPPASSRCVCGGGGGAAAGAPVFVRSAGLLTQRKWLQHLGRGGACIGWGIAQQHAPATNCGGGRGRDRAARLHLWVRLKPQPAWPSVQLPCSCPQAWQGSSRTAHSGRII